jgi:hypothetical protein
MKFFTDPVFRELSRIQKGNELQKDLKKCSLGPAGLKVAEL